MTQKTRQALSIFRFSIACAAAVSLVGCAPHLAGTHDAALEYAIEGHFVAGSGDAERVAAAAKARLSAAQIASDVDATPDQHGVRVVVDADLAAAVDGLLLWDGALAAYPAEQLHAGSLEGKPLVEFPFQSVELAERGRALTVTVPDNTRDALVSEQRAKPNARIVIARGRTPIATMSVADALATPLVLHFGDDVTAYSRAAFTRDLLESPPLPPMRRISVAPVAPDLGLAAACAILPFALSFAWLLFVRRFDRARPEPIWLVVATFALGGLSVVPAGVAEIACSSATPWLDPQVMTLGGQAWALPVAILIFSLVVGASEEGSKFLGAWSLARHRREFDEPVDGIIYGCAAALGFAAVENVKYFAVGRMSGAVIAARTFMTVPAHMFFGAIWGYAMGRRLISPGASVLGLFVLAAVAHGTFDALLSTNGAQPFAGLLMLALAFGFVTLLRSALRHGAVGPRRVGERSAPPPTQPLPSGELDRVLFRVGSRGAFYVCAAGIIACAFALTVLGTAYEYLHHRVGLVFVTLATAILGLFGISAYGIAETIPLDVAIDAQGVTMAGGRTPWRMVVSLEIEMVRKRAYVVLQTTENAVRLGPTAPATAQAIAQAIRVVHASV